MFNIYEFFNRINELDPKIRLDAGQPDIPVDGEIIAETVRALRAGETGYTSTAGIGELREAIANLEGVSPEEVMVGPGAKIFISAVVARARRIAVVSPHWNAYTLIANEFKKDVEVIKTRLEDGWLPQVEEINADLLILNYPNNPTGRVPSREELKGILEAAEERGIKVLSDEVYAELSFKEHTPVRELYENTITVKGFSKLYSMTGFRLGYAIAQREDAKKLREFIEVTATCVPPFVQRAGIKALELRDRIKKRVRNEYRMRVKRAVRILNGLEFYPPEGAFYVFLRVPGDGLSFAERLLNRGVAVFPGVAFGDYRNFIRISLTWKGFEEGLKIIREEVECASESSATGRWEGSSGSASAGSTR